MPGKSYHEEEKQKNTIYLREMQEELPSFLGEFFIGISQTTSIRTRVAYAHDLKTFFTYMAEYKFKNKDINNLTIKSLNSITSEDIDKYLEYVSYYTCEKSDGGIAEYKNDEKGKARKLAAVRSMYKYFYKRGKVPSNPASIVDTPKMHDKKIVRLDVDEVASLLDEVEKGENLTEHQKAFHKRDGIRDLAIVTTLVGTGMRVSECVGINVSDLDFSQNGVKVTRKGGNQVVLYFGDEVCSALKDYLEFRKERPPKDENDDALFLSSHGKRINVRTVQNLIKKYSCQVIKLKNISPHKLRSTYGTNLYHETGDIYLVADVLGHKDVNTTKKHYAEIEENRRKSAAKYVKLRKD